MREEGYYWVKADDKWIVAEWYEFDDSEWHWLIPGWGRDFNDSDFEEIDEKRLTHE